MSDKRDFWWGVLVVLVAFCIAIAVLGFGLNEGYDMAADRCDHYGAFENDGTIYKCEKSHD